MIKQQSILQEILIYVLLIYFACFLFDNEKQQSDVWIGPYFSGAANLNNRFDWYYSPKEVIHFSELTPIEKDNYRFNDIEVSELVKYDYNSKGFLYFTFIARHVFFWKGDISAIESFQILLFIVLNVIVLITLKSKRQKILFLILFALNPLIVYYVTYPYNFFYQIVISLVIIWLLLSKRPSVWKIAIISILVGLSIVTRPSSIFLGLAFVILLFLHKHIPVFHYKLVGGVIICLIVFALPNSTRKNPWFTMYVGIGAYSNNYVKYLSDNEGYKHFKDKTGITLNASIGGNYYEDSVQIKFKEQFKESYLSIIKNSPWLVLKNSIVNFFQGFSVGYLSGQKDWVNYMIAITGVFIFFILIYFKQSFLAFLIILNNIGFIFYYPPIQAYMLGAYPLLVLAFIRVQSTFVDKSVIDFNINIPCRNLSP